MSRTGSRKDEALIETMLVQDDIEYMGTLCWLDSGAYRVLEGQPTYMSKIRTTYR